MPDRHDVLACLLWWALLSLCLWAPSFYWSPPAPSAPQSESTLTPAGVAPSHAVGGVGLEVSP